MPWLGLEPDPLVHGDPWIRQLPDPYPAETRSGAGLPGSRSGKISFGQNEIQAPVQMAWSWIRSSFE